jgi:hypothetical protein
VARQRNAIVLDNKVTTVDGLTIAGIGDPEFTPTRARPRRRTPTTRRIAPAAAGNQLADTIRAQRKPVDIAMVHDPAMAHAALRRRAAGARRPPAQTRGEPAAGAGPARPPRRRPAPRADGRRRRQAAAATRLMVEGSTGGAGLRGLEKDEAHPAEPVGALLRRETPAQGVRRHPARRHRRVQREMQRNVIGADPETGHADQRAAQLIGA